VYLAADDFTGSPDDTVLGIVIDGKAQAYPIDIMNWHEIVNFRISDQPYSLTYCPLTGSGILYDTSSVDGSTFGTTGSLWENNLLMYDRITDNWWSQMLNLAICEGDHLGKSLAMEPIVETTWSNWKALYPETEVLSRNTGYFRDYNRNPYPGYTTSSSIFFTTSYDYLNDNFYHQKEMTLILEINDNRTLYPHAELSNDVVVNSMINDQPVVIVHGGDSLVVPFSARLTNGTVLDFSRSGQDNLGFDQTRGLTVFQDQTGTIWNLRGEAIVGPLKGEKLDRLAAYNAYWFAAKTFFNEASIYISESDDERLPITNTSDYVETAGFLFPSIIFLGVTALSVSYFIKKYRRNNNHKK
jgi:hypothetical protein